MEILVRNFGKFKEKSIKLESMELDNGEGKTTIVNAYHFALSGKTLAGFEPIRVGMEGHEITEVTLCGFMGISEIRRVINIKGGTLLYVNGDVCTQTFFKQVMLDSKRVDIDFVLTCVNSNILADGNLTSEDLRNLLLSTDVIDNGEAEKLRKELDILRKNKRTAEKTANTIVEAVLQTLEPINVSEKMVLDKYTEIEPYLNTVLQNCCPTCKVPYSEKRLREEMKRKIEAEHFFADYGEEIERIKLKELEYRKEQEAIRIYKNLSEATENARKNVQFLSEKIEELEKQVREEDLKAIKADLPEGLDVIVEKTAKTGSVKSVCTITHNGVPLRSLNTALRIHICVELLSKARERRVLTNDVPIIVDNAERIQELNFPNVIKLSVKK